MVCLYHSIKIVVQPVKQFNVCSPPYLWLVGTYYVWCISCVYEHLIECVGSALYFLPNV